MERHESHERQRCAQHGGTQRGVPTIKLVIKHGQTTKLVLLLQVNAAAEPGELPIIAPEEVGPASLALLTEQVRVRGTPRMKVKRHSGEKRDLE